jgi:CBS domain-containing protein
MLLNQGADIFVGLYSGSCNSWGMQIEAVKVRDIMEKRPIAIVETQALPAARALMNDQGIRHLPVIDASHALVGLVTDRNLLKAEISASVGLNEDEQSDLQFSVSLSQVMVTEVRTTTADELIVSVASDMVTHRDGCRPVLNRDGRLSGIVTETDIMDLALKALPHRLRTVADLMVADPIVAGLEQSLSQVDSLMGVHSVRHLPVVDDQKRVLGVISNRDILRWQRSSLSSASSSSPDITVRDVLSENVWSTSPEASLHDAAQTLRDHAFSALPVVEESRLVGILTETDFLRFIAGFASKLT